ncbi:Manganese transport protein MntH [Legionella lansingensis]|uniref:Divalent metal cation transporter MntH n=1 Tax=Legionella lansingensis TaxID=45067 RepID=A0A0W0VSS9_9GAMM|nr:divalent metal cation transporter [Legionella lansingensis]KTD22873.1 Divalent metal cation transporter MntH [Legionella lansingensis]SNV53717.1 Manganese transport protein MntH [Legionella lansingensis]
MVKEKPSRTKRVLRFFKRLGPGLITGASDDDPSGIATYSQAGAQFGLLTLWTALITFPLMLAIQEMCARIGIVTSKGLATNIKKHYPKPILGITVLFTAPAIILNIGADIAGMGAVANLVMPIIPAYLFSLFFTLILIFLIIFLSYKKIVAVLKYLCLSLLLYLIIPFLIQQNWIEVLKHTFVPTIQFNKEYLSILVAILGTTISPYLFFWQATMEAENYDKSVGIMVGRRDIKHMNKDVAFGMLSSNLVMYFIIFTTGTILFKEGITNIETVEQAAKALEPLAGKLSYLLFALGVIGTGFLAIPVLGGCLSYTLTTLFGWKSGLDKQFYKAKCFYLIIIVALLLGLGIDFIELNPFQALLYTAILYGLTAPLLIAVILHLANNKKIMGKFTNGKWSNIFGFIALVLMTLAALLLIYFYFSG